LHREVNLTDVLTRMVYKYFVSLWFPTREHPQAGYCSLLPICTMTTAVKVICASIAVEVSNAMLTLLPNCISHYVTKCHFLNFSFSLLRMLTADMYGDTDMDSNRVRTWN
jgi:hypothetical protein